MNLNIDSAIQVAFGVVLSAGIIYLFKLGSAISDFKGEVTKGFSTASISLKDAENRLDRSISDLSSLVKVSESKLASIEKMASDGSTRIIAHTEGHIRLRDIDDLRRDMSIFQNESGKDRQEIRKLIIELQEKIQQ